jgi:hypothetical protein
MTVLDGLVARRGAVSRDSFNRYKHDSAIPVQLIDVLLRNGLSAPVPVPTAGTRVGAVLAYDHLPFQEQPGGVSAHYRYDLVLDD